MISVFVWVLVARSNFLLLASHSQTQDKTILICENLPAPFENAFDMESPLLQNTLFTLRRRKNGG